MNTMLIRSLFLLVSLLIAAESPPANAQMYTISGRVADS